MQGKEKALQSQNKTRQSNRQDKDNHKIEQLKAFVSQSKYIKVMEQRRICESFGLPYLVNIFREEYRKRFYDYLNKHTTTVATVSKATEIPHKYLCEVKAHYENKGMLKVLYTDRCPTTGSKGVQFVSTNPDVWNNDDLKPKSNQISLF
jgi:hypothetical protein